jgi:hypothetical protein
MLVKEDRLAFVVWEGYFGNLEDGQKKTLERIYCYFLSEGKEMGR